MDQTNPGFEGDANQWASLSHDLLATLDPGTRFVAINTAWERVLGWSSGDLVGTRFPELIHPEDKASSDSAVAVAWKEGVVHWESRVNSRHGAHRRIAWTMNWDGRVFRAAGQDVTELRNTQEQLLAAQRLASIGQSARGLAHDFNNVLSIITGYTEIAQAALSIIDPAREDLSQVLNATARAQRLIQQLLAFERCVPMWPQYVELNRAVRDLVQLLQPLVGSRITTTFTPADQPCWAAIDPVQLDQIVLNLAANARDAIDTTGELSLRTQLTVLSDEYCAMHPGARPGEYATLIVTDTGSGMEPDVVARAFEPFFTTKPPDRGTGLGLSIVYGAVKQAGGYIWVESWPGGGTRFELHFTRAKTPTAVATGER
jgi:PAS domain S-box-containing protein